MNRTLNQGTRLEHTDVNTCRHPHTDIRTDAHTYTQINLDNAISYILLRNVHSPSANHERLVKNPQKNECLLIKAVYVQF